MTHKAKATNASWPDIHSGDSLRPRDSFSASTHPNSWTPTSTILPTCLTQWLAHTPIRKVSAPLPRLSPHAQLPRSQTSCPSWGRRLHYSATRMCKSCLPGHPFSRRGWVTGGTKFLAHAPDMCECRAEAPAADLEVPGGSACASVRVAGEEGSLTTRKFEYHSSKWRWPSWRLTSWSRWKISGKPARAPVSNPTLQTPNSFSASVRDTCLSAPHPVAPGCRFRRSSGTPVLRPLPALSGRGPPDTTPLGLPCAPCSRVTRSICQSCACHCLGSAPATTLLSSSPCSLSSCPTPSLLRLKDFLFSCTSPPKLPAPVLDPTLHHPSSQKSPLPSHVCMHPVACLSHKKPSAASVPPASSLVHLTCRHLLLGIMGVSWFWQSFIELH